MYGTGRRHPCIVAAAVALLVGSAASVLLISTPAAAAACSNGSLICNGGFEGVTAVADSDAVLFDNWTGSAPDALRSGPGASNSATSAAFLFSTTSLSQAVTTDVAARYNVTFQFKSEGGQSLAAYFGDALIFNYSGESAVPTDWTTYSFNVQAFSSESILRFVANSQGAAQYIDDVVVTACPTCTTTTASNLGGVIDRNQSFYTTADTAGTGTNLSGTRTLTFDGGTLRPATAGALGQAGTPVTLNVNVASGGGVIDNNGQSIALAGRIINTGASATPFMLVGAGQDTISSTITNRGTLVVATGGRTTLSGTIDNAGGILAVRNGGQAAITGAVTGGAVSVDNGQLSINSRVASTVTVGTQGTLRGTGTVAGATTVSGTLRPGNSPGTLTFTAPVTQATGSTLALEIDGTGTGNGAGNYSRVIVTGAGNGYSIGTGVVLTPVLRGITYATGETAGTNSVTLSLGQRLAGVVQADGGVTGSFASITQPTAGLANGTRIVALYNPNSIDLFVAASSFGGLSGLSGNQKAAGLAVDALEAGGSSAARPLLNRLIPLGLGELTTAMGGLSGDLNANLPQVALDTSRSFGDLVTLRQGRLPYSDAGWQSWGRGFGTRTKVDGDNASAGFKHNTAGSLAGVDYANGTDLRVGVAVGYAQSDVTGRHGTGTADINNYYAGTYLGWQQDALFLDAQVGVTFNRYDTDRQIVVGNQTRVGSGDTDGRTIGAGLTAGYRLDFGPAMLVPSASLRYDSSRADAFTETGADDLSLTVAADRQSVLRAGLGVDVRHLAPLNGGGILTPELSARWVHDLSRASVGTTQSLLGRAFTIQPADTDRDTAILGAGLAFDFSTRTRIAVRYDLETSGSRTQHGLTAQVRILW